MSTEEWGEDKVGQRSPNSTHSQTGQGNPKYSFSENSIPLNYGTKVATSNLPFCSKPIAPVIVK